MISISIHLVLYVLVDARSKMLGEPIYSAFKPRHRLAACGVGGPSPDFVLVLVPPWLLTCMLDIGRHWSGRNVGDECDEYRRVESQQERRTIASGNLLAPLAFLTVGPK